MAPFWTRLKRSRAKIIAVAIDMSPAYISAVMENLLEVTIVFDHFHVIKLFNEKFSGFRRALYHQATTAMGKAVLKGTLWLLLKNPEYLDQTRNEHQRLQEALQLNGPLSIAYYLKEDLRQLWSQSNKNMPLCELWAGRQRGLGGNSQKYEIANLLFVAAARRQKRKGM